MYTQKNIQFIVRDSFGAPGTCVTQKDGLPGKIDWRVPK